MQNPGFWDNPQQAAHASQELTDLKEEIVYFERFWQAVQAAQSQLSTLVEIQQNAEKSEEEALRELEISLQENVNQLSKDLSLKEREVQFSGPYDKLAATLSVYSGAGGRDAADWAEMLLRMYVRFCEKRAWPVRGLHEHRDEEGGIKSATIEVSGKYVFGTLKHETGVHRLVRISPFDANKRRHTSFALIDVVPVLPKEAVEATDINPQDIEADTFRASGPGGQYVNRRESAVRIRHKPTGFVVECQSERLQGENKARAMAMLAAKLTALKEAEHKGEIAQLRGERKDVAWGNQIRSYVLHPYQIVKDHRTNVEVSNITAVLDGGIDPFIEAETKI
ncbi:MAG: peptide chain release factor 2 [Candidatus Terrybacteria bacterium RIFCSPHIGHO2_01_FULL_48_17]|uniref:Peptide chain release factor 2 n=1 Tax=Candidatus Terrybacteria bacterium RIFCSPHIGHO2_01_FULL_48_17 TaxID=1802362 RepID=A0A1G2PI15_9BACT|nr:MAG: peptide chain release factor 2 [Candidatus Terrybacteria bacterium RIFCSPHIGHO2_01_FULL_48_17]OHA53180.1 MAG: peptide chain release factor 2 [Candidatus Terrybacteria bacterium RIFCSPLOWO2_01_FULL_48_14]